MSLPVLLDDLEPLVAALRADGYQVIGPTVREGAIVLAELDSAAELPYGVGVELAAGRYRLVARADRAAFAHSAGPQSWKTFLHPPRDKQWEVDRSGSDVVVTVADEAPPRYAFLGVRPCDLAAIGIQDGVLAAGTHPDSRYARRRAAAFVIVAQCTEPGAACFCVSAGGGPGATDGYDLALTEDPAAGTYLAQAGSPAGAALLERLPHRDAPPEAVAAGRAAVAAAADRMGRTLPAADLRSLLAGAADSPRWDRIADRCLACANCTLVCPTCFCTSAEDVTDLTGDHAERWRHWASCFDLDFSYLHGGSVRNSRSSRYRQWLTHKFSTWHDQFGTSGCVGCGRCVVWCPAGIDITAELAGFAADAEGGDDDRD